MKRVIQLFPWRRQAVQKNQIAERYARSPEGLAVVRLHLHSPDALLMPFERFPPHLISDLQNGESPPILNLNKELIDYLFARLAELGDDEFLLKVALTHPSEAIAQGTPALFSADNLRSIIQRYFAHLESVRRQNLQQLTRDSFLLGLLGLAGLGVSVVLDSRTINIKPGIGLSLLIQGVTVFGWLTFWEALANGLWNWRPLYRQLQMCQRLQQAPFEIEPENKPTDISIP